MSDAVNRREFSLTLAAATVAPLAGVTLVNPAPAPAAEPLSAEDLVARQLALIQELYPDERLQGEALDEIRMDLERQIARSKLLSEFQLTNADEPACGFAAYRSDDVEP